MEFTKGRRERKKRKDRKKIFEELMGEISKFDENYKFTTPGSSQSPSTRNLKKTIPTHIISQLLKTISKEKNLKSSQRESDAYVQSWDKDEDDSRFLLETMQMKGKSTERQIPLSI